MFGLFAMHVSDAWSMDYCVAIHSCVAIPHCVGYSSGAYSHTETSESLIFSFHELNGSWWDPSIFVSRGGESSNYEDFESLAALSFCCSKV